jgi:hypothetical protein
MVGGAVCLAFLMCFSGCAPVSDADYPDTAAVTGSVTYNGEAVEGAIVSFSPTAEDGHGSIGTTDAQGNFTIQTKWAAKGAVPGSYAVSISKTETQATSDADLEEAQIGEDAPPAAVTEGVPAKYKSAETSGLTAEVTADGENNFPFELTD